MMGRGVVLALALAGMGLAGCVSDSTGIGYAGMVQKLGPPRAGQARIVVLQEKYTGFADGAVLVKLDGGELGLLKLGTYVYADRPAGHHEILATQTLFPGDSKRDVVTEAGRTYFFQAKTSERAKTLAGVAIAAGLAGALVATAVTSSNDNLGPVDIVPLGESLARTTLAELRLAD